MPSTAQHSFIGPVDYRRPIPFDLEDLPSLGWLRITYHGSENTYFSMSNGRVGMVKA